MEKWQGEDNQKEINQKRMELGRKIPTDLTKVIRKVVKEIVWKSEHWRKR